MNHISLLYIRLCLAWIFLSASQYQALAQVGAVGAGVERPKYEGPLYALPSGPLTKLRVEIKRYDIDGNEGEDMRLSCPAFTMCMPSLDGWVASNSGSTSAMFYMRSLPDVQFSISVYSTEDFIPDITGQSIIGYYESLRKKHGDNLEILNEPVFQAQQGDRVPAPADFNCQLTPYNLDMQILDYRINSAPPKNEPLYTRHREYFFILEDLIVMTRFSSPEKYFDTSRKAFERSFGTMNAPFDEAQ